MLNQEKDARRFELLLDSSEWEFTREGGENPEEDERDYALKQRRRGRVGL